MNDIVEQIKDNCDIVDIVGRYVNLKRSGSNYKGLCPFHSEKTPSFLVSQEKQIFTCFGCGKTGDVIKFVQEAEGLDFGEALEKLGDMVGIEVKRSSGGADKRKEELYEISRVAAIHFYKNLRHGANDGLKYVVSRGISPETAVKFGIGYAENGWQDLFDYFKQKQFSEKLGLEVGLFAKNKNDGIYDKFRNRVIFPIKNTRDKVIGFGGRAIDDSTPKYLNSPESLIFKKKENLYGLNLAKNAIRKKNLAIMVEGYMDVVSLFDAGIENVVATLGTAMTIEQAKLLKRYTDVVVLAYDSDGAGQAATARGIDILQYAGCRVKILQLDEGKDPDEYVRKHGREAFDNLVEKAVPYMEYKIARIKNKYDMNTTDGSIRFLEEVSAELRKVTKPAEQAAYIKLVAAESGIPESSVKREVESAGTGELQQRNGNAMQAHEKKSFESDKPDISRARRSGESYKAPVIKTLIKLMIGNGKYIPIIAGNDEISEYFYGSGYEKILEQLTLNYTDDGEVDTDVIADALDDREAELFRNIVSNEKVLPISEEDKTLIECAKRIKLQKLKKRQREIPKILEVLDEEENKDEIEKLSEELMNIGSIMNEIKEGKE